MILRVRSRAANSREPAVSDVAFVAGPVEHDDLEATPSFVEELVLVSAPEHRSLEMALGEWNIHKLFVFRVGCSYRQRLRRLLRGRGITLINPLAVGNISGNSCQW